MGEWNKGIMGGGEGNNKGETDDGIMVKRRTE